MLKYLFILCFSVIHKSIVKEARAIRTIALVTYSLTFLVLSSVLKMLIQFNSKNGLDVFSRIGILFSFAIVLALILSIYFSLDYYYLKSKRYIKYVDNYNSYDSNEKKVFLFFGIILLLGSLFGLIYMGISFSHFINK